MLIDTIKVADGELVLPLRQALQALPSSIGGAQVHPLAIYNRRVSAVTHQATRFLDALDKLEPSLLVLPNPPASDLGPAVHEFQELTYRLAEHYEFLFKLPETVVGPKSALTGPYREKLKRLSRSSKFICNKIKHNSYQLVEVSDRDADGWVVHGVALMHDEGPQTVGPTRDLFDGGRESASFNLIIREEVCQFLQADRSAALLCMSAHQTAPLSEEAGDRSLFQIIRRIDALPERGFLQERAERIDTVRIESKEAVSFGKQPRRRRPPPRMASKRSVKLQGDGVTKSYRMPDWNR